MIENNDSWKPQDVVVCDTDRHCNSADANGPGPLFYVAIAIPAQGTSAVVN